MDYRLKREAKKRKAKGEEHELVRLRISANTWILFSGRKLTKPFSHFREPGTLGNNLHLRVM